MWKSKKIISVTLVILWMALIFWFSHQDASESSSLSNGFIANIYTFLTGKEASIEILKKYSLIVRKLAHFSVYFILGLLFFNVMYVYNVKYKYTLSIICSIVYSISDEIHQIFIPGRAGQVLDVIIDSSGSILAIILCYYLLKFINYRKKLNKIN